VSAGVEARRPELPPRPLRGGRHWGRAKRVALAQLDVEERELAGGNRLLASTSLAECAHDRVPLLQRVCVRVCACVRRTLGKLCPLPSEGDGRTAWQAKEGPRTAWHYPPLEFASEFNGWLSLTLLSLARALASDRGALALRQGEEREGEVERRLYRSLRRFILPLTSSRHTPRPAGG